MKFGNLNQEERDSLFRVETEDLKLLTLKELQQYVAKDIVTGRTLDEIESRWQTSPSTIKSWDSDPYYQTFLDLEEHCKKKNTPITLPWEILKKRLNPAFLKAKLLPSK